ATLANSSACEKRPVGSRAHRPPKIGFPGLLPPFQGSRCVLASSRRGTNPFVPLQPFAVCLRRLSVSETSHGLSSAHLHVRQALHRVKCIPIQLYFGRPTPN